MMKATRWSCVGLLTVGAMLFTLAGTHSAQEKTDKKEKKEKKDKKDEKKEAKKDKKPNEKHDAAVLSNTLREVINTGVKMFNDQRDYAGCFHLYQGSLISVRPFLPPDLQKKIDTGLANAEGMRSYVDRAYELRRVLDDIRANLKGGDSSVGADTGLGDKGQIGGKLSFNGKAIAGGYFVTLVGGDGKKFSSAIQKDGSFQFKTLISAGDYRIAIEAIPGVQGVSLPARYASEGSSSLTVRVQAGKQQLDLNLVK